MKQFVGGFVLASVVWVAVLYAQSQGELDLFGSDEADELEVQAPAVESGASLKADEIKKRKGRRRRAARGGRARAKRPTTPGPGYDTGEGVSGDALGSPGAKELAMGRAGGEDQLSPAEIDQGIDRVFRGIERCLVLVPSQAPAAGKVVLGMHIASSGQVTRVNLKGPNVLIQGEVGACFRRTVKSIRYRNFDGPDMIVHYPIVFE